MALPSQKKKSKAASDILFFHDFSRTQQYPLFQGLKRLSYPSTFASSTLKLKL